MPSLNAIRVVAVAVALWLLDVALTLQDVWPTPGVQWVGEISVELAAVLGLLALWRWRRNASLAGAAHPLAALWLLLTIGRYAAITAPALYGRPINLYWDMPHVGNVIGMFTQVAPWWAVAGVLLGLVLVVAALYLAALWAWRRVLWVLDAPRSSLPVMALAAVTVIAYGLVSRAHPDSDIAPFTQPVLGTYAAQAALVADGWSGSTAARELPASPALQSSLKALQGGDVVVMFLESYGSSTYDRPEFVAALQADRARLDQAIHDSHREVVSAFVTSPTFGGGSWLAHLSLMSGIEISDPGRYAMLMTQQRDTLATPFRQQGYRTVAMMPGLRLAWPEGSFYRFDTLHDARTLAYAGPEFGWFHIPDQFSLAKLEELELRPTQRAPVFALFPTLSTHLPFRPTPPYQPDWARVVTPQPYDAEALRQSLAETPAWLNMGDSYMASLQYTFQMLAGFLALRQDPQLVLVLLGDHQPAANTSGEHASWDVPVHVVTGNARVLAQLREAGFVTGLAPRRQAIGRMDQLAPVLLKAFE